jgi:hypothetical protein
LDADKEKPNLLKAEGIVVKKLTPRVGSEIDGIQLSQLSDAQKNELALLIAERGVVVFRNQDFKDSKYFRSLGNRIPNCFIPCLDMCLQSGPVGAAKQKEFGSYFGRLHVHVSLFTVSSARYSNQSFASLSALMSRTTLNFIISTWAQIISTAFRPALASSPPPDTILMSATSTSPQVSPS